MNVFTITMKYGLRIDVADPKGNDYEEYVKNAKRKAAGISIKAPRGVKVFAPEFSKVLEITMYTATLFYLVDIKASVRAENRDKAIEKMKSLASNVQIKAPDGAMHHGLEYDYTKYVEESHQAKAHVDLNAPLGLRNVLSGPGSDAAVKVAEALKGLTEKEKDAIYKSLQYDRVYADILSYSKDKLLALTDRQAEWVALYYVECESRHGSDYWDSIASAIKSALYGA